MVTSSEVVEVIVVSMRDAFLAVTVFVAAMVLLFSWLQYITAGKFVDAIRANKRWQPVIGALMGITPGCGGAIVMMPMYARGYVTYGTVIATLIATLGDAAFVLIGAAVTDSSFIAPVIAVHLISFIVGVFWGYLVDGLKITPRNPLGKFGPTFKDDNPPENSIESEDLEAHEIIDDLGREEAGGWRYFLLHQGYTVWWMVTAIGLIFAVLLLVWTAQDADFNLEIDYNPLTLHGFITWIGLLGTSLSVILYISQKNWIRDDTEASIGDKLYSMRETMIHSASETAFVTFWVMAAYLVFEFSMLFSGMAEADLARYGDGLIAVVLAAFIGLIPGCGPQIIAITAYTKDLLSFPALTANAISQDGDALFPLLVRHRAASLWATIHTTIPALIVGVLLMVFEVSF
ncbi:putative manganese transporter [Candidatus Poseidoniales archaeon]|nr:putative manganese transporter [Candidatus Poseidoniales archaeon]MDB4656830.1 putative manganese transporter [Candidatus Poseidoniaceae archaeon]